MGNITPLPFTYFESFADEIASKFNRLQSLVGHPTASGDYHEEILRGLLRTFLSKRFSVKKGFIHAGPGNVSKQLDIMIIDESSPAAYIFQEGDFAVVIPRAVVAVAEVKSVLTASDFDASLQNIASAKALMQFPVNLTGILFGFSGTPPTSRNLHKWFTRQIPSRFVDAEVQTPEAMMFFGHQRLLIRCKEAGQIAADGKYFHRGETSDEGEFQSVAFQISIVLALLINACERKQFEISRLLEPSVAFQSLVQATKGGISSERFRFAEGLSTLPKEGS